MNYKIVMCYLDVPGKKLVWYYIPNLDFHWIRSNNSVQNFKDFFMTFYVLTRHNFKAAGLRSRGHLRRQGKSSGLPVYGRVCHRTSGGRLFLKDLGVDAK